MATDQLPEIDELPALLANHQPPVTNHQAESAEPAVCLAIGCGRQVRERGLPMCMDHWLMLPGRTRSRLLALEDEWPAAFAVGVELAAEALDQQAPHWNRGGWRARSAVEQGEHAARRLATFEKIRAERRVRLGEGYADASRPYREELAALVEVLGERSALRIALAVIRGGHFTDGYDPLWICAGLDLDQECGAQAQRQRRITKAN